MKHKHITPQPSRRDWLVTWIELGSAFIFFGACYGASTVYFRVINPSLGETFLFCGILLILIDQAGNSLMRGVQAK